MKAGCIGELVVDFISTTPARSIGDASTFEKCPGGSPANVAVSLHQQGIDTTLVSRVGPGRFGVFMLQAVETSGLSVDSISRDAKYATRCVFMAHDDEGQRSVEIANRQSADQFIPVEEVESCVIPRLDLLHVGGTTMLGDVTSATTFSLAKRVKLQGGVLTFDPNINLSRISDIAKQRVLRLLAMVDILKVNEDEYSLLLHLLTSDQKPALVVCTRGAAGATVFTPSGTIDVAAGRVDVTDVTGAGDAFFGAFLGHLITNAVDLLSPPADALRQATHHANSCAAEVIQQLGGLLSQQSSSSKS